MRKSTFLSFIVASLVIAVPAYAAETVGVAEIKATAKDSPITGNVTIKEKDEGIQVEAEVKNVPDPGKHGFHFHEVGDCSDEGKAAGGHFNPENTQHGFLPKDGRQHAHAGDMGNIEIAADGTGKLSILLLSDQDAQRRRTVGGPA
jgi:superoxide dismutase, Cu-Zn family